jgi:endonuclease/exonuclease/phosphatase family metal-dependent hydrolase
MFEVSNEEKCEIKSIDTTVGSVLGEMSIQLLNMIPDDVRKTMQLPGSINIVVGGRYELSCNVDVSDGLANGASGTVKKVSSVTSTKKATGIVWMQFDDDKVGKQTRNQHRNLYFCGIDSTWTPVLPISRQFQVGRSKSNQVIRKQFPLRHSAAKTIHRCQGDTLDTVVVDFSTKRKEPHTHYVGLSRVRSLEGLFILNLAEDKMHVSEIVRNEMIQLRSERKLSFSLQFPYALSNTHTQVAFLNVRSLCKHIEDVRHDFGLMACDVCIFCETRLMLSDIQKNADMYSLPGYELSVYEGSVFSDEPAVNRSHYGLTVYSRLPVKHSFKAVTMSNQLPVECVISQIELKSGIALNVVSLYRQVSSSLQQFRHAFELIKQHLNNIASKNCQQYTLIMGDFNLNWLEEPTQKLMAEILPDYNQFIQTVTTDYSSILDHAYTDLPADVVMCYTTECYYSDHKPVVCGVKL